MDMTPRYIFMAGAPGSKWSSVCKNIYRSADIDQSDYSDDRTYYHSAWGQPQLMHLGSYFDPGMEFGAGFDRLSEIGKDRCEAEFNRPFNGTGTRIIKSHVFCNHLDWIRATWPSCPIVLCYRPDDACLGWWVRCREFRITYPDYQWYGDLDNMARQIDMQNSGLVDFALRNDIALDIRDNVDLCRRLGIKPPVGDQQDYAESDVRVGVSP